MENPISSNRFEIFFDDNAPETLQDVFDTLRLACCACHVDRDKVHLTFFDSQDNKVINVLNYFGNFSTKIKIIYYGSDHSIVRTMAVTLSPDDLSGNITTTFSKLSWFGTNIASYIDCTFQIVEYDVFNKDNKLIFSHAF